MEMEKEKESLAETPQTGGSKGKQLSLKKIHPSARWPRKLSGRNRYTDYDALVERIEQIEKNFDTLVSCVKQVENNFDTFAASLQKALFPDDIP